MSEPWCETREQIFIKPHFYLFKEVKNSKAAEKPEMVMSQYKSNSQMHILVTNLKTMKWLIIDFSPSFEQLGVFLLEVSK